MIPFPLQDGKWDKLETASEEEEDSAVANGTVSAAPEFCQLQAERGETIVVVEGCKHLIAVPLHVFLELCQDFETFRTISALEGIWC